MAKLQNLRRDYLQGELDIDDLLSDPIAQFNLWLEQVIASEIPDPTAMTVATVSADGQPSQRIVLLKDVGPEGFVFYTNLSSRKATELKSNPKISLHFPWHFMERQVNVCGEVESLSKTEVAKYFLSRPKESQLAAWASKQSHPISSRQMLLNKFAEMKEKFKTGDVSLPEFWGGYRVRPHEIEFWQGGANRLHNRFTYTRESTGEIESKWHIQRLMP